MSHLRRGHRLGMCGYAAIFRMLMDGPISAIELVERAKISPNRARIILNKMHDMGLVHVSEWVKPVGPIRVQKVPRFSLGSGVDAVAPYAKRPRKPRKDTAAPELVQFCAVIRVLSDPITLKDLAAASGSGYWVLRRNILTFKALGLVHVADWVVTGKGGAPAPMYQFGAGRDAARPKPIPRAELDRRHGAKRKERKAMQRLIRATAANVSSYQDAA